MKAWYKTLVTSAGVKETSVIASSTDYTHHTYSDFILRALSYFCHSQYFRIIILPVRILLQNILGYRNHRPPPFPTAPFSSTWITDLTVPATPHLRINTDRLSSRLRISFSFGRTYQLPSPLKVQTRLFCSVALPPRDLPPPLPHVFSASIDALLSTFYKNHWSPTCRISNKDINQALSPIVSQFFSLCLYTARSILLHTTNSFFVPVNLHPKI